MAPKRSRLVDKAIQFCCEIATLFEINKATYVTYRTPNFIKYSTDCSTSKMSHFDKDYMFSTLAYKVGKETGQNVFKFMKKEILQDIEFSDSGERRSLHRALNKFFDKNETAKKKFIIRLSGLIPTYLISHKPYITFWNDKKVVCDEAFFLKYIYELAMEMLRPCLINFSADKYKQLKLAAAEQYEEINNSMDNETTIKENGGNTSIVNDGET